MRYTSINNPHNKHPVLAFVEYSSRRTEFRETDLWKAATRTYPERPIGVQVSYVLLTYRDIPPHAKYGYDTDFRGDILRATVQVTVGGYPYGGARAQREVELTEQGEADLSKWVESAVRKVISRQRKLVGSGKVVQRVKR